MKKTIKIIALRRKTILRLSKALARQIFTEPVSVVLRMVDEEEAMKKYLMSKYGYCQLPTIDILDLFPGFSETVNNYSFLDETSLITDIAILKALARKYDKCCYLEIGALRGESLANVAEVAERCLCITLSKEEMKERGLSDVYGLSQGFYSKEFSNVTTIYENSQEVDFDSMTEKFDLIFVDGDHNYEGVKIDSANVFKILRNETSTVVWHDYGYGPERVRYSVLAGILDGTPTVA